MPRFFEGIWQAAQKFLVIEKGGEAMQILEELLYTKEHEWIKVDGDTAIMGITAHATEQLGDIVFVELPPVGEALVQMKNFGVVESVKTVSDLFAPVSGEVIERNPSLLQEIDGEENEEFHPEYVNEDPYGKGWMLKLKLKDRGELQGLLSPSEYEKLIKQ
jgi:glycine cleavage system H protein